MHPMILELYCMSFPGAFHSCMVVHIDYIKSQRKGQNDNFGFVHNGIFWLIYLWQYGITVWGLARELGDIIELVWNLSSWKPAHTNVWTRCQWCEMTYVRHTPWPIAAYPVTYVLHIPWPMIDISRDLCSAYPVTYCCMPCDLWSAYIVTYVLHASWHIDVFWVLYKPHCIWSNTICVSTDHFNIYQRVVQLHHSTEHAGLQGDNW